MVNHPNRKPASYQTLIENHTSLFLATRSFQKDALRVTGQVMVVGNPQWVPLWICVEWDSKTVLVGYHWEGGNGCSRAQIGREEWFRAAHLVDTKLGDRNFRLSYYPSQEGITISEEVRLKDHETIVEVTTMCQAALDSAEQVSASLKDEIRHALSTGDTYKLSQTSNAE